VITKLVLLLVSLVVMIIPAFGQAVDESESRFGTAFKGFEIRPGIILIVRQTTNGKPSQVSISRYTGTASNYLGSRVLDPLEVKQIIDQIVPEKDRGAGTNGRFPVSCAGQACEVTYDYEFVSIHLITSTNSFSNCHADQPAVRADTDPSNHFASAELILIDWKNR